MNPLGMGDATAELLHQSRSLQASIEADGALPPVSRSIHQIAEASEKMLTEASAGTKPAEPDAETYKFLQTQGVDPMSLDPSRVEIKRREDALPRWPGHVQCDAIEDLDQFLEDRRTQIIHDVRARTEKRPSPPRSFAPRSPPLPPLSLLRQPCPRFPPHQPTRRTATRRR